MKKKQAWVEIQDCRFVRIFRTKKDAFAANCEIMLVGYVRAVSRIRRHLFVRSSGLCEICLSPVTESSGHMHEKKHRGQGGEISLENSIFICPTCHRRQHRDRNPRWKNTLTN